MSAANEGQSADGARVTVVGIGASAGGLAALQTFFEHVPEQPGVAFVVVVHLLPEHDSHLAALLQPHTALPVVQVTDGLALDRDRVYIIPPNANLEAIDTHLRLAALEAERQHRAPIDHFFWTLARSHGSRSIGVILTGTGSDGTLGLRYIKAEGGLTVVQDPAEAEFDGMPQSAVAGAAVDLLLPLVEIPEAVSKLARVEPRLDVPAPGEDPNDETVNLLHEILGQIHIQTGRDFAQYKRSTLLRRITRRMQFNQIAQPSDYVELLRSNRAEVEALADELLITVTSFVRDPEVFDELARSVFPQLFVQRDLEQSIRAWSVGCSTGEEAYTLGMLLLEEAERHEPTPLIQLFASDLHEPSLAHARAGFYPGSIASDVSEDRLERFFIEDNDGYRVGRRLREITTFAPHNLLSDPPFSRLDLISCRNLLIYLQRDLQQQVIELFHYALAPGGYLLVGSSEHVDLRELFELSNKAAGVYRRRNVPTREPRLPVFPLSDGRARVPRASTPQTRRVERELSYGQLHQAIVEEYGPPSVLLGSDDDIVHFSVHAGRYLVHPGGEVTATLTKLVRPELRSALGAALQEARHRERAVRTPAIEVRFNGESAPVVVSVRPALSPEREGYLLVLFDERESRRAEPLASATDDGDALGVDELLAGKERAEKQLRVVVEENETSREELRASNEELQSANEELRSTLEELETSKEELQSMNEELQTVNQENRSKVEELARLTDDLQNLFAATDIATLFLDRRLRITRFTPKVAEVYSIRMSDRGRPLSDLTHRLGYGQLDEDAKRVLETLAPIQHEVLHESGRWYLVRILPYRQGSDRIAGVVITFVDISEQKHAQDEMVSSVERYRALAELSPDAILVLADSRYVFANAAAVSLLGAEEIGELLEHSPFEFLPTDEHDSARARVEQILVKGEKARTAIERWIRIDGRVVTVEVASGPVEWEGRAAVQMVVRDVTDRKRAEDVLYEQNRKKDEYLAMLGHELRNPLAAIRNAAQLALMPGVKPQQQARALEILDRRSRDMTHIIDGLLEVSRIARGKVTLEPEALDLGETIERAVDDRRADAERRGLALEVALSERAQLWIRGDETRLTQVVDNLLSNAIKFTEHGKVTVTAGASADTVVVRVVDTGCGMPAQTLEGIFESFHQGEQDQARQAGGLGLGLSLCQGLIELHRGTITAHSEGPGTGSTFEIRLPRLSPPQTGQTSQRRVESQQDAQVVGPLEVVLVEDNEDAGLMLETLLESLGHRVTWVTHANEALDHLSGQRPDLVLCDLGLPGMTGIEFARVVRDDPDLCSLPLVAVTGYSQSSDRRESADAGFDAHLVKPVELDQLNEILGRLGTRS